MSKFGVSQNVLRKEDLRFTTGQGRYVDDTPPEDAKFLAVFRAPIAHGVITALDVSKARQSPGVSLVLTALDINGELENSIDFSVLSDDDVTKGASLSSKSSSPTRPILAEGRVRFLGEPLAMVVADTKAQAVDAMELIEFDYDELPSHTKMELGGAPIHDDAPDNKVFDWSYGDNGAVESAFKKASHRVEMDLTDNRIIANSIEPRGCLAEWEGERLHMAYSGQGVWGLRDELASKLGLDSGDVRVTTPDVGGGFGMKAFHYPEYFMAALACKMLKTSVRWTADRSESMLSDNGGRDLITKAEVSFDDDFKMTGLRVYSLANMGAYCSGYAQFIQTELALKVLTGVYDIQNVHFHVQGLYTNTTQIDAYRGAGRPEAIYVMERLMDYAARVLGQDPIELKRRNFIEKSKFPYTSASQEIYDVGDFDRVLDRALIEGDISGFEARKTQSAKSGKLRGLGLAYYIESILGDQNETTKIEFTDDGFVNLYVGTQSNGQGHETVFAQILNERSGIPFEKVRFVQGDSDLIKKGGGTGGSRSVTMQGNSINVTSDAMIEKFKPLAEEDLEASAQDIVFEEGAFRVAGTDRLVDVMKLSEKARQKGMVDLLTTELESTVPARSFPNGAHLAEVEIDPDTGETVCVKYTVVDDFGVLMNPMLAEGQVHGGVAQGIGQAITENVVYDEDGQLLTGSFMDYALPRATDVPNMPFHTELIPSTANDIGMKGCGEAGTVGALAAVTNAALDAVWDLGVRRVDMPMTPLSMWERIQSSKIAAE